MVNQTPTFCNMDWRHACSGHSASIKLDVYNRHVASSTPTGRPYTDWQRHTINNYSSLHTRAQAPNVKCEYTMEMSCGRYNQGWCPRGLCWSWSLEDPALVSNAVASSISYIATMAQNWYSLLLITVILSRLSSTVHQSLNPKLLLPVAKIINKGVKKPICQR